MTPTQAALNAAHRERRARLWGATKVQPPKEEEVPADVAELKLYRLVKEAERVVTDAPEIKMPLTVSAVMHEVADFYAVSVTELLSHQRNRNICRIRHAAMYLAAKLTKHSLPQIGRVFGGRDHTTVMNAVRQTAVRLRDDDRMADEVQSLAMRLVEKYGESIAHPGRTPRYGKQP